jgi:hypothetical protein
MALQPTRSNEINLESDSDEVVEPPQIIPQRRRPSTDDSEYGDMEHTSDHTIDPMTPPPPSTAVSDYSDRDNLSEDEGAITDDGDLQQELESGIGEDWEHELDERVQNSQSEIQDWSALRAQIKADLKKQYRQLSLSQINQMMILSNFATLRLKGLPRIEASERIAEQWHEKEGKWFARRVRALARHYQNFEQLPMERRGGLKKARTLLCDENVKNRTLDYLRNLPSGKVTPKKLQAALNATILPDLGITTTKPLCVRTARRWLIKLGWRHTAIKKGVYMDGHERSDVVAYRNDVFLPAMAKFETRMAQYDGPQLTHSKPKLAEGEREIIPCFHDESTFYAYEEGRSAWLRKGEQPLRKKGKGRNIHVSAFINPETGRLVRLDENGNVVQDSTKVIYPGSGGDPWWDCAQLMEQMKDAVDIFESQHPGKQALFVFDNSSAHASLPPDALKAFEMNKSDGGKQRKQHDTVIPATNPTVEQRGKAQKMTLPDGRQKGLQRVLEERGFKVSKLRAKCSPICPIENENCCMARLLSQQDDFKNQPSMLENYVSSRGHLCIFLPKFHCELNPIEMVSTSHTSLLTTSLIQLNSIGDGANTAIGRQRGRPFKMQKMLYSNTLQLVQQM